MADQTDANIILDPRVGEKARAAITARFHNVLLDTAVCIVADMAGLAVARLDNVFYVTDQENATRLQAEQDLRRTVPAPNPAPAEARPDKGGM